MQQHPIHNEQRHHLVTQSIVAKASISHPDRQRQKHQERGDEARVIAPSHHERRDMHQRVGEDESPQAAVAQDAAVGAALKTQKLTRELYQGGLASSLELTYAQGQTLTARIDSIQIKADLLRASVALIS